jgi:hypothetical protein
MSCIYLFLFFLYMSYMLLIIKIIVSVKMQMSVILCSHGLLDWFNKTILYLNMRKSCAVLWWTFSHVINIILRGMIKGWWYWYQSRQTNTDVMFFQYYICKFPLFSTKYMIKLVYLTLDSRLCKNNINNCLKKQYYTRHDTSISDLA